MLLWIPIGKLFQDIAFKWDSNAYNTNTVPEITLQQRKFLLHLYPTMLQDTLVSLQSIEDIVRGDYSLPPPKVNHKASDPNFISASLLSDLPERHPAEWMSDLTPLGFLMGGNRVPKVVNHRPMKVLTKTYSEKLQRTLSDIIHNSREHSVRTTSAVTREHHMILNSSRNPSAAGLAAASPYGP